MSIKIPSQSEIVRLLGILLFNTNSLVSLSHHGLRRVSQDAAAEDLALQIPQYFHPRSEIQVCGFETHLKHFYSAGRYIREQQVTTERFRRICPKRQKLCIVFGKIKDLLCSLALIVSRQDFLARIFPARY